MKYEYIRVQFDLGDLTEINKLASVGFRVVVVVPNHYFVNGDDLQFDTPQYALMERPLPEGTRFD
jgi:hypothetical protein